MRPVLVRQREHGVVFLQRLGAAAGQIQDAPELVVAEDLETGVLRGQRRVGYDPIMGKPPKSSYELVMERLRAADPKEGKKSSLTAKQKNAIAEARRVAAAREPCPFG